MLFSHVNLRTLHFGGGGSGGRGGMMQGGGEQLGAFSRVLNGFGVGISVIWGMAHREELGISNCWTYWKL